MDNAQPQKTNSLVQNTRAVGQAVRAGDLNQLKTLAQAIGKAGGSISSASAADLGNKPSQLTQLTRKAGNSQADANQRAVHKDRPPHANGR